MGACVFCVVLFCIVLMSETTALATRSDLIVPTFLLPRRPEPRPGFALQPRITAPRLLVQCLLAEGLGSEGLTVLGARVQSWTTWECNDRRALGEEPAACHLGVIPGVSCASGDNSLLNDGPELWCPVFVK